MENAGRLYLAIMVSLLSCVGAVLLLMAGFGIFDGNPPPPQLVVGLFPIAACAFFAGWRKAKSISAWLEKKS